MNPNTNNRNLTAFAVLGVLAILAGAGASVGLNELVAPSLWLEDATVLAVDEATGDAVATNAVDEAEANTTSTGLAEALFGASIDDREAARLAHLEERLAAMGIILRAFDDCLADNATCDVDVDLLSEMVNHTEDRMARIQAVLAGNVSTWEAAHNDANHTHDENHTHDANHTPHVRGPHHLKGRHMDGLNSSEAQDRMTAHLERMNLTRALVERCMANASCVGNDTAAFQDVLDAIDERVGLIEACLAGGTCLHPAHGEDHEDHSMIGRGRDMLRGDHDEDHEGSEAGHAHRRGPMRHH